MRRLALRISISVDGFIAGPNGEVDWMAKTRSPAGAAWVANKMSQAGAHLVGRKSFVEWTAFWPTATGPLADAMNNIPKIVFSKSGFDTSKIVVKSWADSLVMSGDLSTEITKLKSTPGKILVAHGGTSFAQSLVQTGLIDEFWLAIHPVVLGKGAHLFAGLKAPLDLKLENSTSFEVGTMANVYSAQ